MSDAGRFTWYELLTSDPDAAVEFYEHLTGWGHSVWEGGQHYQMFTRGEVPVAGVMQLPEQAAGAPPHWLGYVHTDDLDATTHRVVELGGQILAQHAIPEVGRIAVIRDPQGAVIAAFQPEVAPAPDHDPGVGEFSWHELGAEDSEAALEFYSSVFGWHLVEAMDMGEAGMYRIFGQGERQLGGMFDRSPEMPASAWMYYVRVPSCEQASARIGELGGTVLIGPLEVPGGDFIVQANDPQGGTFALHSVVSEPAEMEA